MDKIMIYNVKTYYINSITDDRLIRYDVIKLNDDTYQVKVFDDQQRGISHPSLVAQIDDFQITREEYTKSIRQGSINPSGRKWHRVLKILSMIVFKNTEIHCHNRTAYGRFFIPI